MEPVPPFKDTLEHLVERLWGLEQRLLRLEGVGTSTSREGAGAWEAGLAARLSAVDAREAATPAQRSRLIHLLQTFELSAFDRNVLILALAPEVDARFARTYAQLQGDEGRRRPRVELALAMEFQDVQGRLAGRGRLLPTAPLRAWELCSLEPTSGAPSLLEQELVCDEAVAAFLLDQGTASPPLPTGARWLPDRPAPSALAAVADALAGRCAEGRPLRALLHGPPGSGAHTVAGALAARLGLTAFEVDGAELLRSSGAQGARRVLRDARMWGALVLCTGFTAWTEREHSEPLRALWGLLADHPLPVLLRAERPWSAARLRPAQALLDVPLPALSPAERRAQWREALGGALPEGDEARLLAVPLSAGQIAAVAASALSTEGLVERARAELQADLGHLATPLTTRKRREDLVLSPRCSEQLDALVERIQNRERVEHVWGLSRGQVGPSGVLALFAGPPGTGKSMTAAVLGELVGLPVARVDLSGVVSKYIGETEKQIEQLLSAAERTPTLLFFDEADALFASRTEVGDAHDRYANLQTSFLLQRVEACGAVVILATNLRRNVDGAFLRRFDAIIEFAEPDEAARVELWRRAWPPGFPLSDDVDALELARGFKLTGAEIGNAALEAAYAVAGRGGPVTRADVLAAIRKEFEKSGRIYDDRMLRAAPRSP